MGNIISGSMTIRDILKSVSAMRRHEGKFVTNYYGQCNRLAETFRTWKLDTALAFEFIEDGVNRIYFFAVDLDDLINVLRQTERGSVVDFLTKEKIDEDVFSSAGYKIYMRYGRFVLNRFSEDAKKWRELLGNDESMHELLTNSKYGEMAREEDAEEIDQRMREYFDAYEAHFWPMEKLKENIRKGWVWVARENGEIIAGNLFEVQGKKLYGAYLFNNGGIVVLNSLEEKSNAYIAKKFHVSQFYCWMRLDNKRAVRFNMKVNGYEPDGLYDFIFVKE